MMAVFVWTFHGVIEAIALGVVFLCFALICLLVAWGKLLKWWERRKKKPNAPSQDRATRESFDDLVLRIQAWGSNEHPESFALAEQVCKSYERQTSDMTAIQRYDFRRAFELGYRFAMLKHAEANSAGHNASKGKA